MSVSRRMRITTLALATLTSGSVLLSAPVLAGIPGPSGPSGATLTINGSTSGFAYRPGVEFSYQITPFQQPSGVSDTYLSAYSNADCSGRSDVVAHIVGDTYPVTGTTRFSGEASSFGASIRLGGGVVIDANCVNVASNQRPDRPARPGATATPIVPPAVVVPRSPRPGASDMPQPEPVTVRPDRPSRPSRP